MERRNLALLCAGVVCFWLFALAFGTAQGKGLRIQPAVQTQAEPAVQTLTVTPPQLTLPCRAAILIDQTSGAVLYEMNADQTMPIASITKVMTLLLTFEAVHAGRLTMDTAVPVSEHAYHMGGSQIWLEPGEQFTLDEMLKAICVSSANDAAVAVAELVGGSEPAFVQQMNARAAELGCTSATFTCAHGLYDYGNVASAEDMAKIAAACAANETFAQVAGSTTYTLGQTNFHSEQRTISSSNPLMDASGAYYKDSVKWVKGGFTTLAGRCAVALAQKDGHTYGLVILGSDSNEHLYSECDELFDWAFASFADRPLVDTQTVVTTVDLTKCRTHPEVELYAAAPVSGYGHADDKVSYSFDLPESVSATVKNGQKLGTATVYLDGCEVGQVDLVTHQEYVSDFRTDSRSTLLLLVALAVILLVLSVVTLACGGGSLNLNRRRRMKRRR